MTPPKSALRLLRAALAAPLVVALCIHGATKNATVSYPRTETGRTYLSDNGSYVTNDFVHIDFTRQVVPDTAALFIDRRQVNQTNDTDWATFAQSTFAEFAVPTNLPCANATNWNWIVYTDWSPPPTVLTNGVLHVNWAKSLRDATFRRAGMVVGIPVQSTVWADGRLVGTPGGTNSLSNANAATALSLEEQRSEQ